MPIQTYDAVRLRQTPASGELVLFAAPALDVHDWSGVPQRERLTDGAEAVGFQRTENPKRLDELAAFFTNPKNVIQNPLLGAIRDSAKVTFTPTDSGDAPVSTGTLTIEWEDLSSLTLRELLQRVKSQLESRVVDLQNASVDVQKLAHLKERASNAHPEFAEDAGIDDESDVDVDVDAEDLEESEARDGAGEPAAGLFTDETHIADFWEEVAARVTILSEIGDGFDADVFLGFTKDAMISYLQPVVIVDGQHRLRGSLLAADRAVSSPEMALEIAGAIESGKDADEISNEIRRREARLLPVSLLMDAAPAEHVFQFVVVNQKATPIGRALLGTIVSTSLSADELTGVSERLTAAGIPLEDSRAIAYLTRAPESPFKDLVEKGLANEGNADLLQWSVLGSLARVFRDLKGGRLDHEKLDYADKWRRNRLDESGIVPDLAEGESAMQAWSRPDGPWREVFLTFWSAVREILGTSDDKDAGNYWGSPRTSNLFNKVTLTILTADFFQFLTDRDYNIDSSAQVRTHVEEWLTDVKVTYFGRDWKLSGVKKDSRGIRAQWSYLWVQYRKDPQTLPTVGKYRQIKS